jgi:hypothetical protein
MMKDEWKFFPPGRFLVSPASPEINRMTLIVQGLEILPIRGDEEDAWDGESRYHRSPFFIFPSTFFLFPVPPLAYCIPGRVHGSCSTRLLP